MRDAKKGRGRKRRSEVSCAKRGVCVCVGAQLEVRKKIPGLRKIKVSKAPSGSRKFPQKEWKKLSARPFIGSDAVAFFFLLCPLDS